MTEPHSDSGSETETEEEDEPILKYSRMADLNDLRVILENDSINCVAVHSRFICVGTHFGRCLLLDHQGNEINTVDADGKSTFPSHLVAVNQISVDSKGEYIATCSSDGTINIFGLYASDFNNRIAAGQPVNAIVIDPSDTTTTGRFLAGDSRLHLYERSFLKGLRPVVLHEAVGQVTAIAWSGHFVAWSSGMSVRFYDLNERCSLGLMKWDEPAKGEGKIADFRCNLRWATANTLLIGWVDTIRICVIRKRNAGEVARTGQSGYIVDPVSTFQTDFFVCGLAPLVAGDQIIVLGQLKQRTRPTNGAETVAADGTEDIGGVDEDGSNSISSVDGGGDDGELANGSSSNGSLQPSRRASSSSADAGEERRGQAQRPIVCVMQYTSCTYSPICTSSITMRGFEEYTPKDYHLECLRDENTYFVVAPKDLIVATLCETDDRIQWLINHRRFDEALDAISAHGGRYSLMSVVRLYVNHLLDGDRFDEAANVCRRWFGTEKELWEEEVYKFVNRKQLRCIKAYLPRSSECRLSPHIYEMVLYEYLKSDTAGFRELIFEWPPTLYNTNVVINAIKQHLAEMVSVAHVPLDTAPLFEALAFLYTEEERYEAALDTYLRLQHREVFTLIRKHDLYFKIESKIVTLIEMDRKRAIELLLEKDKIDPDVVVRQLEKHEEYLYWFLEAHDRKDRSGRFHSRLIQLYARFDRDLLLPFLRRAQNYNIQQVLDMCRKQSLHKETVFLLGCTGNNSEALHVYLHQMDDFGGALDFCKQIDDTDLWMELITFALQTKPGLVRQLMDGVVGFLDPRLLVQRIDNDVRVPGLHESLVRMLQEVNLQTSIQAKCNDIMMVDYFGLHRRHLHSERRAIRVGADSLCTRCGQPMLGNDMRDMVAFNCRHLFHGKCYADVQRTHGDCCSICESKKVDPKATSNKT